MPRDSRVWVTTDHTWTNKHQNFTQQIDLCYDVWNPPPPVTDGWGDMKLTVAKLQSLIAQAAQDSIRLRAYGGTWSLSRAAVTDGRLINTKPLNWWFPLAAKRSGKHPARLGRWSLGRSGSSRRASAIQT